MADGTLKVGTITTSSGSGTITLGQSGETITVPSGATITNSGTATGFGGANTPMFRAHRNANVTLSNGTNTIITFDDEDIDTGNMYDSSNGKFTPTTSGKYFLFAVIKWSLNGGINYIELRKNGSNTASMYTNYSIPNGDHVYAISNIVEADGDDYFEINVYQGSGGSETLYGGAANSFFGGYKIIE